MGVQSDTHGTLLFLIGLQLNSKNKAGAESYKLLLMSITYRQTSKINTDQLEKDPENRLHGRASRFGCLQWFYVIGHSRVVVYSMKTLEALSIPMQLIRSGITRNYEERDFTYPQSTGTDLYRRSIYTFWRRTVAPTNMFDAANRRTCTVRLNQTCTPSMRRL